MVKVATRCDISGVSAINIVRGTIHNILGRCWERFRILGIRGFMKIGVIVIVYFKFHLSLVPTTKLPPKYPTIILYAHRNGESTMCWSFIG